MKPGMESSSRPLLLNKRGPGAELLLLNICVKILKKDLEPNDQDQ